MTTKTANSMKQRAAKMAADTGLNTILDAFSTKYQAARAAVMAKEMTTAEMQIAVREAGRVRDAAMKARN